jgi:hypothetical protein
MPFLVRSPPEYAATDDYSLTYTIIEPDANDRTILRDLQHWGWLVSQHDFDDEDFIYALKGIEKDTRERRRNTHAVAGEMLSHRCKPRLEELWELEARRMLENTAYDEESNEALNNEHPLPVDARRIGRYRCRAGRRSATSDGCQVRKCPKSTQITPHAE